MGNSGNVFETLLAREGPSSSIFENSKNLAPSSGRGRMRELQSSTIPAARFNQGFAHLNPYCRTDGMMDYPWIQYLGTASREIR